MKSFVTKFRKLPSIAAGKAKMLINKSLDNGMVSHLELESINAAWFAGIEDFKEGVAAFVEKRKKTVFQRKIKKWFFRRLL